MTKVRSDYIRPVDFKNGRVDMTHGGGGRAMAQLIEELFARAFANEWLAQGNDNALFVAPGGRMVLPLGQPWQRQDLALLQKRPDGSIEIVRELPVAFVPLTREDPPPE